MDRSIGGDDSLKTRHSTIDGAAKTKDTAKSVSNIENACIVGSTSSSKDLGIDKYATKTGVLECIYSTEIDKDDYESEGEDIESFSHMFESPDTTSCPSVIRASRKTNMPSKYNDYMLKAVKDSRWVEVMDLKMEALNRNITWKITELPNNRKSIVLDIVTGICLTQRKYHTELLSGFGMLGCKPCSTPIEVNPNNKRVVSKYGDDEPFTCITHYQKLVGKLIYLTMTRSDISYVVHCLSQVMHSLMKSHLRLAFRVLKYLKREPSLGITFNKSSISEIIVFADSDRA
ncbi:ribonuclease H-like domain-containing protein [Tanacetum coccineum]